MWNYCLCTLVAALLVAAVEAEAGLERQGQERRYPAPHYSPVAPCPCDLAPARCDPGCCCDSDCAATPAPACSPSSPAPAPASLLPVVRVNSGFLGEFYVNPAKVESRAGWERLVGTLQPSWEVGPGPAEENSTAGYRAGAAVRTVYSRAAGLLGKLSLPAPTLTGRCASRAPVRFLEESHASCPALLTPNTCASGLNSLLDRQMFLMQFGRVAAEPEFPQVLSYSTRLQAAPTTVRYHRALQPEFFLSRPGTARSGPAHPAPDTLSQLGAGSRAGRGAPVFPAESEEYWPDRLVHFSQGRAVCREAVLAVVYTLGWAGQAVLSVEADILLGNLSLSATQSALLRQQFSVAWQDGAARTGPAPRLPRPGYLPGELLVSPGNSPVRAWASNAASSLCRDNQPSPVREGLDLSSGCLIAVTRAQLETDCTELAAGLARLQDRLLGAAATIARAGNISRLTPILRENASQAAGPACWVPAGARLTLLTTRQSHTGREAVVGARYRLVYSSWTWRCHRPLAQRYCSPVLLFPLSTEVEFITVPAVWHLQNTSRFWVKQVSSATDKYGRTEVFLHRLVSRVAGRFAGRTCSPCCSPGRWRCSSPCSPPHSWLSSSHPRSTSPPSNFSKQCMCIIVNKVVVNKCCLLYQNVSFSF